jgi:hypothetical protein
MGLGLLAKAEGKDAVHRINVTSHRFHGENAGSVIAFDLERNEQRSPHSRSLWKPRAQRGSAPGG